MRGALLCFALLLPSCSRTPLELADTVVDGSGGNAGSTAAGGSGSGAGSSQTCASDTPALVPIRERRWLAFLARPSEDLYLVEMTEDGPENLTHIENTGTGLMLDGWSADGRFFAYTRTEDSVASATVVLDFSQGAPVPVQVPQSQFGATWAPVGTRYRAGMYSGSFVAAIVDAATGAEQSVETPALAYDSARWSPDGRFFTFAGERSTVLVDTFGPELVVQTIHEDESPHVTWSSDGRYLAIVSENLHLYDSQTGTKERVGLGRGVRGVVGANWVRNEWLTWTGYDSNAYFLDVSRRPFAPVILRGQTGHGFSSPGGKCVAYEGDCLASQGSGTCVRMFPPDAESLPMLIAPETPGEVFWAGSGEHLFIHGAASHVELDFASRSVTDRNEFHGLWVRPYWNPSGRPDWLFVTDRDPNGMPRPNLWHRETTRTHPIDIGGGSYNGIDWSPDGRYLALQSYGDGEQEFALYVQEVLGSELGESFNLSRGVVGSVFIGDTRWQP